MQPSVANPNEPAGRWKAALIYRCRNRLVDEANERKKYEDENDDEQSLKG